MSNLAKILKFAVMPKKDDAKRLSEPAETCFSVPIVTLNMNF